MFHGSIVALITPMKSDRSIDLDALDALIEWQINEGTQGIVVLGTTGESATISLEEREQIILRSVKQTQKRIPLLVGTGANDTETAINLTLQAMELGANGVLLVSPYYNKPTQEGLFQHYKAIAHAAAIPQILYNVPSRTGSDLLPETVARLSEIPNIVAIKQASDSIQRLTDLLTLCEGSLDILSGDDGAAVTYLLAGAKGLISVTANVAPRAVAALCAAASSGNKSLAFELNRQLMELNQVLFVESNPIPTKWLLKDMGKIGGGIRLPLTELAEKYHATVRNTFAEFQKKIKTRN